MREGLMFLQDNRTPYKFDFVVSQLKSCSDRYVDCDKCPDLKRCVSAFDKRTAAYNADDNYIRRAR